MSGLLLDTHVIAALINEPSRLSPNAVAAIQENLGELFVSAISGLELAQHEQRGRVRFAVPVSQLMPVLVRAGIQEIPLGWEAAAVAPAVPVAHKDPFDRILVATALGRGLSIVTRDQELHSTPGLHCIW